MAGDVAVAGIAGGGAGADRRVSLGLGYGKGAHEVAAFCRGAGAAGAADVHASEAAWWPRLIPLGPVPISSGSVAVGDRFLSGPAVPAAPPPPVPVVPFGGGLNWWMRRWS